MTDQPTGPESGSGAMTSIGLPSGRQLTLVALAALAIFTSLCLLRVHGFSLCAWHEVIDASRPEEILIGSTRFVRSDDWSVTLPLVFSQMAQEPKFPVRNQLVGYGGANNLVGVAVPTKSWVLLLRPQLWGYLAGRDFGLAWHWWSRALMLLYSFWLVFSLLTRGRIWISLAAAIALLFAPFFQFWSLNYEPTAAMMGLAFVASVGIFFSSSTASILLSGLLLAWAGGAFTFSAIYPPYQITLGYLFVFLAIGFLARERAALKEAGRHRFRLAVGGAACAVVLILVCAFVAQSYADLLVVGHTLYPGQRRTTGGDLTLLRLFNSFFNAGRGVDAFLPLGNICEGAAFFFMAPGVLGLLLWERLFHGRRFDPVILALAAYCILMSIFGIMGLPSRIAAWTLLDRVPGYRSIIGTGIADAMITAVFLASPAVQSGRRGLLRSVTVSAIWTATLATACTPLLQRPPGLRLASFLSISLIIWIVVALVLQRARSAMVILAVMSMCTTGWFNPLVRGGAEYLESNALSREILALDKERGPGSLWIVFNDVELPNLLRGIGVHAVNGVHFYPQKELWSRLDPERKAEDAWNRYAQVVFALADKPDKVTITAPVPDTVLVRLHPEGSAFARLGADFILYAGDDIAPLEKCWNLAHVAAIGDRHIFRVLKPDRPHADSHP